MGVISVYCLCDEAVDAAGVWVEVVETGVELHHPEQHQANGDPDSHAEDIEEAISFLKEKDPPDRFAKRMYHILIG